MNFLGPLIVPPEDYDYRIIGKFNTFWHIENLIDDNEPLYMITWCPDPKELPDCDFNSQHRYFGTTLVDYLQQCKIGLFCVETTQLGSPHYHGWYQIDPKTENRRIIMIKVLQRFGLVKITKSKGHYKKGSFSNKSNCLFYYKKDSLDSMNFVDANPIHCLTDFSIDYTDYMRFFTHHSGRKTVADLESQVSLKDFYTKFYSSSL